MGRASEFDGSANVGRSSRISQSISGIGGRLSGLITGSSSAEPSSRRSRISNRRWPSLFSFGGRGSRVEENGLCNGSVSGHFNRGAASQGWAGRGATSAKDEIERIMKEELSKFDFAIRDDSFAEQRSFGFTSSEVYAPVDDVYAPVVGNIFGMGSKVYHMGMFFLAVASCVLIPLRHSFFLQRHPSGKLREMVLEDTCKVINILYGLGFCWSLRFSVVEAQFNNFNPSYIIRSKLRNWDAWVDIGSVAFAITAASHEQHNEGIDSITVALAFAQVVRCWRLLRSAPCFKLTMAAPGVGLMRLFFFVCIQAHVIACVWYYITTNVAGSFEAHLESTLGAQDGLFLIGSNSHDAVNHYMFAYREVWMMIVSDTRPALSNQELLISIVMAPAGGMIMALLLAETIQLIHHMNLLQESQAEQLAFTTQALRSMSVPSHLAERILSYQLYMQHVHNRDAMRVLFENLSSPLALELQLTLFHGLIAETPFFETASANILKCIVMALEDCFFQPGDFVIRKTEPATEMFFVVRGICEVIPELEEAVVKTFENGDYFGEIALLRDGDAPRTAWVRAAIYSHLCQLSKDDFGQVMETFPEQRAMLLQRLKKFEVVQKNAAGIPRLSQSSAYSEQSGADMAVGHRASGQSVEAEIFVEEDEEEEEESGSHAAQGRLSLRSSDGALSSASAKTEDEVQADLLEASAETFASKPSIEKSFESRLSKDSAKSLNATSENRSSQKTDESLTGALTEAPAKDLASPNTTDSGNTKTATSLDWKSFSKNKEVPQKAVHNMLKRGHSWGLQKSLGEGSCRLGEEDTQTSKGPRRSNEGVLSQLKRTQSHGVEKSLGQDENANSLNSNDESIKQSDRPSQQSISRKTLSKLPNLGGMLVQGMVTKTKSLAVGMGSAAESGASKPNLKRMSKFHQMDSDQGQMPMFSVKSVGAVKANAMKNRSRSQSLFIANAGLKDDRTKVADSDDPSARFAMDIPFEDDDDQVPDMIKIGNPASAGNGNAMAKMLKTKTTRAETKSSKKQLFKGASGTARRPSAMEGSLSGHSTSQADGTAQVLDKKMDMVLSEIRDLAAVVGPLASQVANISRSLAVEAANNKLRNQQVAARLSENSDVSISMATLNLPDDDVAPMSHATSTRSARFTDDLQDSQTTSVSFAQVVPVECDEDDDNLHRPHGGGDETPSCASSNANSRLDLLSDGPDGYNKTDLSTVAEFLTDSTTT